VGEVWFSGVRAAKGVTEIIDTSTDAFTSTVEEVTGAYSRGVDDGTYAYGATGPGGKDLIRTRIFDFSQSTLSGLDFDITRALGAGSDLWVPQTLLNTLGRVNRSTFTLSDSYAVPRIDYGQTGVAWDGASTLYLATLPAGAFPPTRSALTVFDTATNTVTNTYTLNTSPSLSRHPLYLGGFVYIHDQPTTNRLLKVNPATGTVSATLNLTVSYNASANIAAGGYIFTCNSTGRIDRIDPTTMTIANTYTPYTAQAVITTDGTSVWASANNSSTVTKIDGATGTTTNIVRPGVLSTAGGAVQWVSGNYGVSTSGWGVNVINW